MYQLFQESPLQPGGEMLFPDFRRVRDGLRASIAKVVDFRRQNPQGLNGSHFLVRLLMSLNVPLSMEPQIYSDKVSDIALNLAMSMKMTSPLSRGQVFSPGVFYGKHVTEVLLANIEPYDTSMLESNWAELRPIKVLYHPLSDLRLNVPDGRVDAEEAGIAVISINIPMLAAQYRMWRQWERGVLKDESPRTVMQFLQAYPIPNMLHSHVDVAILNRMIGLYFDVELNNGKSQHSFYLTDWTKDVDRTLKQFLKMSLQRKWDFDTIISHMPVVGHEDMHEVIQLPPMAFSQQVQWAVVLARLALVIFLVRSNADNENPRNRPDLNYLRRYLRQMELNRTMHALPDNRYDDVMVLINDGLVPFL